VVGLSIPLDPVEGEALGLLLRFPALVTELSPGERLPFRDAAAIALVAAWRDHVTANAGTVDLEGFVGGLDPATASLARDLLGRLAAGGEADALEPQVAREALRICFLRLRVGRIDEALRDGRLLMEEAQRESDQSRLEALEQQITRLGREKADATRAMRDPAQVVGARRS
jgi:hypothetical protein